MKNYRTTLIGAALAGLSFLAIYQGNGGDLAHWQQWLIPVTIAVLGYVAKDAGVSGSLKLLLASLCLLTLPSCTTTANGGKAFLGLSSPQWLGIGQDAARSAMQSAVIGYSQRRLVVDVTSGK
jgi:hypothetical protein